MTPRTPSLLGLSIALLVLAGGAGAAAAQSDPPPPAPRARQGPQGLPPDIVVSAKELVHDEQGNTILEGPVAISWQESAQGVRLQADRITFRDQRWVVAEGSVLLVWGENRISGARATYDLQNETGEIEQAIGKVEPLFFFWAKSAQKVGPDKIHLDSATITTCTQPVPYWSFSVSSANIRIDQYAHMWNVRLKTGKLPVIYLPYLVWPVKQDRAFGLLIPQLRSTRERGQAIHQELFVPLGRSADLTVVGRYYTEAGFGGGGTLRVIPNANGEMTLSGFFIDDEVAGFERYRGQYNQTQKFKNGFRMVADINVVSDFNYFTDFEKELQLVSSPTILARLEFSRNNKWTSLNVRELRREQLFSGGSELVQWTLPEIEWRGRSRRLGRTPLYLSFESSLAAIRQEGTQNGLPIDADYRRGDLYPTLSMPLSRLPWLEINPQINYRVTYFTQQQRLLTDTSGAQTRVVLDEALTRRLFGGGLQIVGPKFFRIFERADGSRFKHTFEPTFSYGYGETFDRSGDLLVFDEIDRFNGRGAQASFGLRSRLFAKRRRSDQPAVPSSAEAILLPAGMIPQPGSDPEAGPGGKAALQEPVEIASVELRQSRSFDQDLSFADLDADGIAEDTSPYSAIDVIGRYNPKPAISVDLRGRFHILYRRMESVSLSSTVRRPRGYLDASFVHREGLGFRNTGSATAPVFTENGDDTQIRLNGGISLFRNRLQLFADGSIDANPLPGQSRIPTKTWGVVYNTQCCTFSVERLDRGYTALDRRDDWFFRVDLTGLGKLFDFSY